MEDLTVLILEMLEEFCLAMEKESEGAWREGSEEAGCWLSLPGEAGKPGDIFAVFGMVSAGVVLTMGWVVDFGGGWRLWAQEREGRTRRYGKMDLR